jgi:hypothetical protein
MQPGKEPLCLETAGEICYEDIVHPSNIALFGVLSNIPRSKLKI